jgi:prepilin-type N-terminal cleavage/methylation domain-containing protein
MIPSRTQAGFTLIELLVVISIIGVLTALLAANFVGIRGRAADAAKKSDLRQLKSALRIYYNDFQAYPLGSGTINGCGDGTVGCGSSFSANGSVYMADLPDDLEYYSDGGDGFLLVVGLSNASDGDIGDSQAKCDPDGRPYFTTAPVDSDQFVVCED